MHLLSPYSNPRDIHMFFVLVVLAIFPNGDVKSPQVYPMFTSMSDCMAFKAEMDDKEKPEVVKMGAKYSSACRAASIPAEQKDI